MILLYNSVSPGTTLDVTFHDGVSQAADGYKIPTAGLNTIKFGIGGTSTAQVYEFRGIDAVGNDNLVSCVRGSDFEVATGTSVKRETWEAPVQCLVSFYVKLVSISGGTSIVKGIAGA
jgi:hypothetical protein